VPAALQKRKDLRRRDENLSGRITRRDRLTTHMMEKGERKRGIGDDSGLGPKGGEKEKGRC